MKIKGLRIVFLLILPSLLVLLTGCDKDLSGTWTIEISPTHASRPGCENSFLGQPVTLEVDVEHVDIGEARELFKLDYSPYFDVVSEGNLFLYSSPHDDRHLLGTVKGSRADFIVWMDNCPPPEYCGDTNHFEGTVSGLSIAGSYEGGSAVSEYAFEPMGSIELACTWGGSFTVDIQK